MLQAAINGMSKDVSQNDGVPKLKWQQRIIE